MVSDWRECVRNRFVKDISSDPYRITSINSIAHAKIQSADFLPNKHHIAKISLLYDELRGLLEAVALGHGYKIYNHECYVSFLKEIVGESANVDAFNEIRRVRNGINYYGKNVSDTEAEKIIADIKRLIATYSSK